MQLALISTSSEEYTAEPKVEMIKEYSLIDNNVEETGRKFLVVRNPLAVIKTEIRKIRKLFFVTPRLLTIWVPVCQIHTSECTITHLYLFK